MTTAYDVNYYFKVM